MADGGFDPPASRRDSPTANELVFRGRDALMIYRPEAVLGLECGFVRPYQTPTHHSIKNVCIYAPIQ